jgi:hypothetical protein
MKKFGKHGEAGGWINVRVGASRRGLPMQVFNVHVSRDSIQLPKSRRSDVQGQMTTQLV